MVDERKLESMLSDIEEAESLGELASLEALADEYAEARDPRTVAALASRRAELTKVVEDSRPTVAEDPMERINRMTAELAMLRQAAMKEVDVKPPVSRIGRQYKLVSTDVNWSTKPQVHRLMEILKAVMQVGEVVDEEQIVKVVNANAEWLGTRQPPKRIWDYYKGNSADGLLMHGNIERF